MPRPTSAPCGGPPAPAAVNGRHAAPGVVEAWTGDGRWLTLRLPHREVGAAAVLGPGRLAAWSARRG